MKAVLAALAGLSDHDLPDPAPPAGHELLVEIRAIAVNPTDAKRRLAMRPDEAQRVFGWDAAGVVRQVGPAAQGFAPGEAVFYAGRSAGPGSNAELQLVDSRIVGHKPNKISFAEAAALPLTTITAWEMLFDRLTMPATSAGSLLVIGGAGGVGSAAIQLARALTDATVIATASRPQTREWCLALGAHAVIDHAGDMLAQLAALGTGDADRIFCTQDTDRHWAAMVRMLAPQGRIGLIDNPGLIDVRELKPKSASLHWESMFTRSSLNTPDMAAQHDLLERVAELVDAGRLRTTLGDHYGAINAANLTRAHAALLRGATRGKIVLEGFTGA